MKMRVFSVRLSMELAADIKVIALEEGITMGQLLREAIQEFVTQYKAIRAREETVGPDAVVSS